MHYYDIIMKRRGKMKLKNKLLCGLLAVGMMSTMLTGCGKKSDDKTFTVGFDAEYPPYGYMDENGDYTSFDLELAEEVCKIKGWKLEKRPISWDSKDMELNSESIDCIWNGFTINGREDDYEWSVPYVNNTQVIVVKADSGIKTFDDLSGKKVGVQTASAALGVLNGDQKELADSFGKLQEFSNYNTAFAELEADSVDAIAMDVGVAQYQIESRGDEFIILDEKLNSEQYGIGFKKGNTELRDDVNDALKTLKENGKFDELAKKYGLEDMTCLDFE